MIDYDYYKNTNIDWIGEIPKDWKVSSLRFFSEIKRGCGYQLLIPYEEIKETTYEKVIRIGDFDIFNPKKFKYDPNFENFRIKEGDILIGGTGHYFGKSILANKKMNNYVHSYNIIRINLKKNIPNFVKNYLSSSKIRDQLNISALGSGQPFIDIQGLKELKILIPPIEEQTLISEYLDKKTEKIDALIRKIEKKIELLKEQKTALINQVVTKGLNSNIEMKVSGVDWIGEIPKHWNMSRIKFHGEVIVGLSFDKEDVLEGEDGTLVLRSSNVQDGKVSFQDNIWVKTSVPEKLKIKKGDILICSRNGSRKLIGKNCLLGSESEGMTWGVFMTVLRTSSPNFFYWMLNSQLFKSQSGIYLTSTINQLTVSTLENMIIPFTSELKEQNEINEFLKKENEKTDQVLRMEEKRINLLKEYRQSLISSVVTGKIRITEDMI